MVWTPPDEPRADLAPGFCDSCLQRLADEDAGRFRHRLCVPPRLPAEAREVLGRMRGAR